jgi:hypothetical protein
MGATPEEKKRNHRQLSSGLCWDCFEQLETGEIAGLDLFELVFYLERKAEKYGARSTWRVVNKGTAEEPWYEQQTFSGMCHEYISDTYDSKGNIAVKGNFESGSTAEEKQLHEIVQSVKDVYDSAISQQRTAKRIELDYFQKTAGFCWFGPQLIPEGFVGDPPGKTRFKALFGYDPGSGDFLAPSIIAEDGTRAGTVEKYEQD